MITHIANTMTSEHFDLMCKQVLMMNADIEQFVYEEMLEHEKNYDPVTGERFTRFAPSIPLQYSRVPLTSPDGVVVYCEILSPTVPSDHAILYVHGAAFQRRLNDINLKTTERLCARTGQPVYSPDYRVGIAYTFDQMVADIVTAYQYLLSDCGYRAENITILADSSGCTTALQAIQALSKHSLPAPGKVVLWSPVGERHPNDRNQLDQDIAFRTNHLSIVSFDTYCAHMGKGKSNEDLFPIYGNYHDLQNTSILIQVGANEFLREDSYKLHNIFSNICPCTLEVYDDMFHNFQTYYSFCDMAKLSWDRTVQFINEH